MDIPLPQSGVARPHPLVLAAAASVTALSLAGVGVLAGWLPGPGARAVAAPEPPPVSVQQTVNLPANLPAQAAAPIPAATRAAASTPAPAVRRASTPASVAAAPVATTAVPPSLTLPTLCTDCGIVEAVREVAVEPTTSGGGAVAGGIVGGLLGNRIGKGGTRDLATVVGVVGGAFAGNHIEKSMKDAVRHDVVVRFEDGSTRVFSSDTRPVWQAGQRVRLQDGQLVARQAGATI